MPSVNLGDRETFILKQPVSGYFSALKTVEYDLFPKFCLIFVKLPLDNTSNVNHIALIGIAYWRLCLVLCVVLQKQLLERADGKNCRRS